MRVTLDEAHSVFLCETYRPTMNSLVHLSEVRGQKVILTATLAPQHQTILAEAVGISLTRTIALRLPTARPNHRLQVLRIPVPQTPFTVGVQLASLLLEEWTEEPGVRGIVFVRTLNDLEEFSRTCQFPICTFYGGMLKEQKDRQLKSWFSSEHPAKWMVSTTALLHGVDYPHVNAVIFLEPPFGLYDFVQGAGRGGRAGQETLVTVLHSGIPPPLPNESPYGCREEMEGILTSPTCRRLGISKVMDGRELQCSQVTNSLLCDFCEGRLHPLITRAIEAASPGHAHKTTGPSTPPLTPQPLPEPSAPTLLNALTAQSQDDLRTNHAKSAKDLLERFGGCFACRLKSDDHEPCHDKCGNSGQTSCLVDPHRIFKCTRFHHNVGWIDWKKTFRWPKDVSRCYFCGLPGSAVGLHSKLGGGCRLGDSALAAAWHVMNTPHLFERLQKELGFTPGNNPAADFAIWVTSYGSNTEDVRILSVFSWLCNQYYPRL